MCLKLNFASQTHNVTILCLFALDRLTLPYEPLSKQIHSSNICCIFSLNESFAFGPLCASPYHTHHNPACQAIIYLNNNYRTAGTQGNGLAADLEHMLYMYILAWCRL